MGNCLKGIFRSDNYSSFENSRFDESLLEPLNDENNELQMCNKLNKVGRTLDNVEKTIKEHSTNLEFLNKKILIFKLVIDCIMNNIRVCL